jgi:hypothetical protein
VHKTAKILDKMPKSVKAKAKQLIHEMYLTPTEQSRAGSLRTVLFQLPGQISQSL